MSDRAELADRVLEIIVRKVKERGYPPTLAEIAGELGYRNRSSVHGLLVELEEAGRIVRGAGPRAITVITEPT